MVASYLTLLNSQLIMIILEHVLLGIFVIFQKNSTSAKHVIGVHCYNHHHHHSLYPGTLLSPIASPFAQSAFASRSVSLQWSILFMLES